MSTRKQRRTRNQLFREWISLGSPKCVTCGRAKHKPGSKGELSCALRWSQHAVTAQIEKLERRIKNG